MVGVMSFVFDDILKVWKLKASCLPTEISKSRKLHGHHFVPLLTLVLLDILLEKAY